MITIHPKSESKSFQDFFRNQTCFKIKWHQDPVVLMRWNISFYRIPAKKRNHISFELFNVAKSVGRNSMHRTILKAFYI